MSMSVCAFLHLALLAVLLSAFVGFVMNAAYNYLSERFKLPNYSIQAGAERTCATLLLIGLVVHANTTEWKPCGQDTISQALNKTPAQPVVASISQNCGCGK